MSKAIDLTGQVYYNLTIIKFLGKINNFRSYLCSCLCGKEITVSQQSIRTGQRRSCGCMHKAKSSEMCLKRKISGDINGFNRLFNRYKYSAKKRNLEFNIDLITFRQLTSSNCYYCNGLPSQDSKTWNISKEWQEKTKYTYNGLDRTDNNVGYIIENVVPCCKKCNFAKHKLNKNEFIDLVKSISLNLKLNA